MNKQNSNYTYYDQVIQNCPFNLSDCGKPELIFGYLHSQYHSNIKMYLFNSSAVLIVVISYIRKTAIPIMANVKLV